MLHIVAPPLYQLHFGSFGRQTECNIDAWHGGQDVGDDAVTLRIAGDLVEHHRRVTHLPHIDVDDTADLFPGLGALDDLQLTSRLQCADPVPQVLVGHCSSSCVYVPCRHPWSSDSSSAFRSQPPISRRPVEQRPFAPCYSTFRFASLM